MKRVTLLLTFLLFTSLSFAQTSYSIVTKKDSLTTDSLATWLDETYSISEMSQEFYECASKNQAEADNNFELSLSCLDFDVMRSAKYTDEGLKAVRLFRGTWFKTCSSMYMELGAKATEYCGCLFTTYQSEPMGMEEILSPEFQGSSENKGFKKACKEKSGID